MPIRRCTGRNGQGALQVLEPDLSRKMIEEAKKRNSAELIEYHVCGIEEVNL